jgi:cytochrome d ubiquinol oxidase subunit II
MLVILFSLIGRGVAVEFRGKDERQSWKSLWDWVMMACSLIASFSFGLVFGNVFRGLPIDANGYEGTVGALFNYYGVLTGLLFVVIFIFHGLLWVSVKVEGELADRAHHAAGKVWYLLLIVAVAFLAATAFATKLYVNFLSFPVWFIVPLIAVVALLGSKLLLARGKDLTAFFASCTVIVTVTFTGIIGLFPNLIPSTLDPTYSLTAYNSSSSAYTLTVMTVVAAIFVPIIIVYQIFAYRLYRKRISTEDLAGEADFY